MLLQCIWNEAQFVLECLVYNSIWDRFLYMFQSVVLGDFKSFFQLDT